MLTSCGKLVVHVDANYVGVWNGTNGTCTYKLSIDHLSEGYWVKTAGNADEIAQGVARVHNGYLDIGLRHFKINELPTVDTTNTWTMVLSGITYTRN